MRFFFACALGALALAALAEEKTSSVEDMADQVCFCIMYRYRVATITLAS
jgi:hypothetical protein